MDWTSFALASPLDPAEPGWLFEAVEQAEGPSSDLYSCEKLPNGCYLVKTSSITEGLILTERSRDAMLDHLRETYMYGLELEGFLGFARNMSKDEDD